MPLHEQDLPRPLRAVAIYGPGLIGGSLAKALARHRPDTAIRIWSRTASCEKARRNFPATLVSDDPAVVADGASLAVFCMPVENMENVARSITAALPPDCVVTDAGSTKKLVCERLESLLGSRFVGSHPMAGSEQSGADAARAGLFEGATCIVTPTARTSPAAIDAATRLWHAVGGRVVSMSPAEHDKLVSRASHLPHALAATLASTVGSRLPAALAVTGRGFRDTTRIAAGPPPMWTGIFLDNRRELLEALGEFSGKLDELTRLLEAGDAPGLTEFLEHARSVREGIE
ncbi:MAG: hypothetical protein Fur0032_13780 [Terrimicrobiaceae bacterium]